jgi:hypothetical protein
VFTVVCTVAAASPAHAERYALLVGVSKYAASATAGTTLDLEGPAEDVPALRRLLVERQGFAEPNIVVLVNEAATRQAILARLAERVAAMRDGDFLLFYFSGHGTSAFDAKMRPVNAFIGPNSGALAPYDLRLDSPERAADSLLIGRRDLRPILERLPRSSQMLVILDACYSENSVRTIRQRLLGKTRGIALGTLLPTGGSGASPATASAETERFAAEAERAYPYTNVLALTAASKDEQAIDIDSRMMIEGKYPTIDGKPHGAFTNSLLEAVSGASDTNRDGVITFQELYDFSRRSVQARFPHTPQLLAPASVVLTDGAAFGSRTPLTTTPCRATQSAPRASTVRVRVDGLEAAVLAGLRASADIQIVAGPADLSIVQVSDGFIDLFDASGSLVRRYRATETPALLARVRSEPALQQLIGFGFACQDFNVSLQLRPEGLSRFSGRDRISIEASVDRDAHLLLLNIDKAGTVSIVYPATLAERGKTAAGRSVRLAEARAAAPFGAEHLKLIAFFDEPPLAQIGCSAGGDKRLLCPDVQPGTPSFEGLVRLLAESKGAAESHLRFITYED